MPEDITLLGAHDGKSAERPVMAVVGCGSAGINIVDGIEPGWREDVRVYACDTAVERAKNVPGKNCVRIGENRTISSGGKPLERGMGMAREAEPFLHEAFRDTDLVLVMSGLGGGTGTGASVVASKAGADCQALTIGLFSLPFSAESGTRAAVAREGIAKLRESCDGILVLPNDVLLEIAPHLPINKAFDVSNYALTQPVECMARKLVRQDLEALRGVLRRGRIGTIGVGEGAGRERFRLAAVDALSLPEIGGEGFSDFIAFVWMGREAFPEDVEYVWDEVWNRYPGAGILGGALSRPSMEGRVQVVLMALTV
jgi:cell division protein FtsZ